MVRGRTTYVPSSCLGEQHKKKSNGRWRLIQRTTPGYALVTDSFRMR